MDWSKSKNVLIFALIITNLLLLLYVYGDRMKTEDGTLTRRFVEKTVEMLEKKGIKVEAKIPRKGMKLTSLRVEFETRLPEELNRSFFHNRATMLRPTQDLATLNYREETLNIVNRRRVLYERRAAGGGEAPGEEEALRMALNFLEERGYPTQDMVCTRRETKGGQVSLRFSKIYEDVLVESSYTNMVVDAKGVRTMDRLWLNIIEISENEITMASAPKALLSLLTKPEYANRTITDLEPCYYFNPEEQGYVEDITKAQEGRAIPAWRMEFDDGEVAIVDIY